MDMLTVTASEANRFFSRLLARVKRGEIVTITSHGKPVAQLRPSDNGADAARKAALEAHLDALSQRPFRAVGRWTRDDLYDRA